MRFLARFQSCQPGFGAAPGSEGPHSDADQGLGRRAIGGPDVYSIGSHVEIHRAPACIRLRARRSRMAVCMRIIHKVRNRKKYPAIISSKGARNTGSVAPLTMPSPWCRVFHHSTEKWMMGILTAPTSAKMA